MSHFLAVALHVGSLNNMSTRASIIEHLRGTDPAAVLALDSLSHPCWTDMRLRGIRRQATTIETFSNVALSDTESMALQSSWLSLLIQISTLDTTASPAEVPLQSDIYFIATSILIASWFARYK